ncbi:MAG: tetraacyldisaccharide 4'-kinase [Gammaproteobacteria bacterium]
MKGSGVRPASLWYGSHPLSILLLPLSGVFGLLVSLRRFAYETGMLRRHKLPVPVIVIGNITVGGTGKTPLVIWLVESLRGAGYRPGVVSRGYGGDTARMPQLVTADSDPVAVGDEPVLIAQRAACPVAVAPRRVMAARALIADHDCNVIVSDDGLQHYALERDMEIAVIDGERRLGNGHYLPAGPLREQATRLRRVDIMVVNGKALPGECHAVAGIGNPARFFDQLRGQGLKVVEHPFPDHHRFRAADLRFGDDLPVVMTEKDAVKCRAFAAPNHWYVPVSARFDADCQRRLQHLLAKIKPHGSTG